MTTTEILNQIIEQHCSEMGFSEKLALREEIEVKWLRPVLAMSCTVMKPCGSCDICTKKIVK